ncbi:MAG: glycerol-3-phosphate 1-O-acyltransferase PlsY [Syntrophomonadaceae bacterium]|nr:glycerol-3-phosphate 1-O-acyltransferase PlsY [Bacillota bacterium]NLM88876.1 glycerol-3-phosphate 1-O-acyltransferase PlsY [Syntrophomonadaceae bacterium]HAA09779.1 acyl-phosphate glycerol 3-phosphate acyltransferase [Syntrophomonas sp.]HQD91164.1 glycerol-3-phosphate 1-O-acyltransferase PlsY [Syntrophomonadaceae bacterium]
MYGLILVVLCYFIGAIPFSYLVSLLKGVDIRTRGSGNVGATNVLRALGPVAAAAALAADLLKGVAAAWIGTMAGGEWLVVGCAFAAVVGHCYPIFLRFKGGKGVATSAGIILYLMPRELLIMLVVFLVVVALLRYVSLGSITVAVLLPVLALAMKEPFELLILCLLMAALVVYRHRENIQRLRSGTEPKLGSRA